VPQRRYQPLSRLSPDDEIVPKDGQLTILTRQSTFKQKERHVYSQERNPDELVDEARRMGFVDIQVYDWDTGIGAYKTTIEDRPALHHWLTELLPSGKSRVLMVSQEDRLFRDKWETEHNAFIRQVATYGGWVICGQRIYNFRRDMDCEQFRLACKYGKQYIESHIIRRMLPALHRSAMAGQYAGGYVPWGYIVDYDQDSATFKRLVPYEPHAVLVVEKVFRRFASLIQPTVTELARSWQREGLVWPFFGADVDPRRTRWLDAHAKRDEALGGYPFNFRQAQKILTDVAYLGWRVRSGEAAREANSRPKVCHAPLVEPGLFWWCYDRVMGERPVWSEGWAPPRLTDVRPFRPRLLRTRQQPGEVRFLAPGKVRCATHDKAVSAATGNTGHIELHCGGDNLSGLTPCARVPAKTVEAALLGGFLEHLRLDERDEAALAKIAQRSQTQWKGSEIEELERQLADLRRRYERIKRLLLDAPDLTDDLLDEARKAKQAVQDMETRITQARSAVQPTSQAWRVAQRAIAWGERICATFLDWPREAQARVLTLALDDAAFGWVDRYGLGVWMRWQGGAESRRELLSSKGKTIGWTAKENEALRQYFAILTRDALQQMMPGRTMSAIKQQSSRLGLSRPRSGRRHAITPRVFPEPRVNNTMAQYGFPLQSRTCVLEYASA